VPTVAVKGTRAFAEELMNRAYTSTLWVMPEEFPVWCAALGVDHFYSYTGRNITSWCAMQATGDGDSALSVLCEGGPAEWVEFPETPEAASRTWQFTYTEEG
jgi:hypothetical protein